MLENLSKMLLGISQKFPLYIMLGLFPIMLDYANRNYSCELCIYVCIYIYIHTHN